MMNVVIVIVILAIATYAIVAVFKPQIIVEQLFAWLNLLTDKFPKIFGFSDSRASQRFKRSAPYITKIVRWGGLFCMVWLFLLIFMIAVSATQ